MENLDIKNCYCHTPKEFLIDSDLFDQLYMGIEKNFSSPYTPKHLKGKLMQISNTSAFEKNYLNNVPKSEREGWKCLLLLMLDIKTTL